MHHALTCFHRRLLILGVLAGLLGAPVAAAGDWPQILGPDRNGVTQGEQPIQPWSASGPRSLWSVDVGSGFAGPAVAADRVVVFHRVGASERLQCLAAATGETLWQADFPASYRGSINPDSGPRCVPVIHQQRIYAFGAAGDLHCVELVSGKKVWSRDTHTDYKAQEGYFGAGSTPIVVDSKLLVNVGGRSAGIVAFSLDTGATLWQAGNDQASYASPTRATLHGKPHAIFVTRLRCVAVDAGSGQFAFTLPFGATGPTVNAATPLVFDNHLFLSASYNVGAKLLRLDSPPVEIWSNDESMSSQYATCVYHDGHLYGVHGREDFRTGELRCVEALTGQVRWSNSLALTGSVLAVGQRLLVLATDGRLTLVAARPDRYDELAAAQVSSRTTRSLPAYAAGRFVFRDNADNTGRLHCLQIAAP
ncbi:MAG: PQQ-binding-like beta-propeller repeat protein [Pirellulaceae bacterium]